MLRRISFIVAFLGICFLIIIINKNPSEFNNLEDLDVNVKVFLEGVVENERDFGDFKILSVNGIDVVCDCRESYREKNIIVKGVVEEYKGKKQVRVLELEIMD